MLRGGGRSLREGSRRKGREEAERQSFPGLPSFSPFPEDCPECMAIFTYSYPGIYMHIGLGTKGQ